MGETADARAWIIASMPQPAEIEVVDIGPWHPRGGSLFATDAVTLDQTDDALDILTVPDTAAQVVGLMDAARGHTAALALIWSDAPVHCGSQIAEVYTSTGLVAFIAPDDMAAMERLAADPFHDPAQTSHADQLAANVPMRPYLAGLEDGTQFPVTGAPVTSILPSIITLMDAEGQMLALYANFATPPNSARLPPLCADRAS
jgi:hypothetical protein